MNSIYFAMVGLAIVLVIFWCVRSDRLAVGEQFGPFAMRRPSARPSGSGASAGTTEQR